MMIKYLAIGFALAAGLPAIAQDSQTCTYSDWAWNSAAGRAENFQTILTTRDKLKPEQIHPDYPTCSICEEDQVEVSVPGVAPIKLCHFIASEVQWVFDAAIDDGFPITKLVGYRVGKTRGPLDENGLRTGYSHHSFGLAIDVNSEQNGLYNNCIEFSPKCRLSRGGPWRPGQAGTITPGTPVHDGLIDFGLKWGGELPGRQKDFMHFSPSGG